MLERETLLRPPSLNNFGFFSIQKSQLLVAGVNAPDIARCDNLSYAPIWPTANTEYEHEASMLNKKSPYSDYEFRLDNIKRFVNVIDASPHFFITYVEVQAMGPNGMEQSRQMEDDGACSATWHGHSMSELLKNLREWQLISGEPFNSEHPMAIISNKFFEICNPSQSILDEIDAMPDMHLARFLRGDTNHREHIADFPHMSQNLQDWVVSLSEQYPYIDTATRISSI
jgi:hypothetical protein